jgi:ABC-type transport system involved in multi-copper enzyme maturation permease subunit
MSTAQAVAPLPFAAPPAGRLVKVELRKMVDTRSGRWLLIAAMVITFGVTILIGFLGDAGDVDLEPLLEIAWLPLSILLSVIGILAATGEWSQRTALTTFALVPRRQRVVVAKLLATALLAAVALVISFAAAGLGTAISGGSWHLNFAHVGDGFLLLELGILGGVAFGLVLMSPALAIVISFVLPTAFSILGEIKSLKSTWNWIDPGSAREALSNADAHGNDWGKLVVSSLIWVVLPIVLGTIRTMRTEAK